MRWGFKCTICGHEADRSFPTYNAMRQALLVDGIPCINPEPGVFESSDHCVCKQMELLPHATGLAIAPGVRTTTIRKDGMRIITTVPDRDDLKLTN